MPKKPVNAQLQLLVDKLKSKLYSVQPGILIVFNRRMTQEEAKNSWIKIRAVCKIKITMIKKKEDKENDFSRQNY